MKGYIAEWKAIFADKKMLISIIGILLIPVLYGGILLWAFWDPYGQLDELPVAIVNEDEGAEVDGEEVNAGDEFVDELLENEDFHWQVTDAEEAQRGFDAFDYYFYIEIPSSFSEDVSSLQDEDPESGRVYYDINEDVNFAASQMGTQAVDTMEEELSRTLTETYMEVIDDAYTELADVVIELEEGAEELADGVDSALKNMSSLTEGLTDLDEGAESLHTGASEAAEGTNELRTEVETFAESYHNSEKIDQLENTLQEMQTDVTDARAYLESDDVIQLEQSLRSLDENWSDARASLQSAEDSLNLLEDSMEDVDQPIHEAQGVLNDISEMNDRLDQWQTRANESLNDLESFVGVCYEWQETDEEAQSLDDYIAQNHPEDETLQNHADTLVEAIDGIDTEGVQACQQIDETVNALNETYDDMVSATPELSEQIDTIDADFNETVDAISGGQENVSNWIDEVNEDLENARSAAPEGIGDGDVQLLEVFPQARSTLVDLDESLSRAEEVLSSVDATLNEAEQAVQSLDEGVQELNEGADKLSSEMQEAFQGGMDIEVGLEELDDGAGQLQENLQTLAETLLENELTEEQQALFTSPVESVSESETEDYTYGEGLSPYFLSLGLFVGGLTLSIVYPFYHPLAEHKTAWNWFFGKLGVVWTVATIQTAALIGITFFGLDLEIASPVWFSLFMGFASFSFMALIFMLVAILDNPGRYIAIILLIIQLGGSGGSFPVELVPSFFQHVHAWLPMTYSVDGLRATIMMDEPGLLLGTWPLLLLLVVSLAATFLFFTIKHKKGTGS